MKKGLQSSGPPSSEYTDGLEIIFQTLDVARLSGSFKVRCNRSNDCNQVVL